MGLISARELDESALTDLFNAGFSDYLLPMHLTEAQFREHVAIHDIDLGCSRVVVDDHPAAFALIARRDSAGWVGGMGTAPGYRRRGLGEQALTAGLGALGERGASVAWLEVVDQNQRALRLYEKLGFEVVRDLIVWSLARRQEGFLRTHPVDPETAQGWIACNRGDREPWQRADQTVDAIVARGSILGAIAVGPPGQIAAAALLRDDRPDVEVLQLAALDEQAAADVLLAAAGAGRDVRIRNVPADSIASLALERLGARTIARQHEMRLSL